MFIDFAILPELIGLSMVTKLAIAYKNCIWSQCNFLYQPTEPLSSVSSLEVHFDLLDLTELTDMSDQELGEVFADSDEENHNESPASES